MNDVSLSRSRCECGVYLSLWYCVGVYKGVYQHGIPLVSHTGAKPDSVPLDDGSPRPSVEGGPLGRLLHERRRHAVPSRLHRIPSLLNPIPSLLHRIPSREGGGEVPWMMDLLRPPKDPLRGGPLDHGSTGPPNQPPEGGSLGPWDSLEPQSLQEGPGEGRFNMTFRILLTSYTSKIMQKIIIKIKKEVPGGAIQRVPTCLMIKQYTKRQNAWNEGESQQPLRPLARESRTG